MHGSPSMFVRSLSSRRMISSDFRGICFDYKTAEHWKRNIEHVRLSHVEHFYWVPLLQSLVRVQLLGSKVYPLRNQCIAVVSIMIDARYVYCRIINDRLDPSRSRDDHISPLLYEPFKYSINLLCAGMKGEERRGERILKYTLIPCKRVL